MTRKVFVLIITLLIFALFLTTPKVVLFYDAPEYVDMVLKNGLMESAIKVHHPIRPIFMMIFWLVFNFFHVFLGISAEYSGNLVAFVYGIVSIFLFYQLSKLIFTEKKNRNEI